MNRAFMVEDGRTAARVLSDVLRRLGMSFVRASSATGARAAFVADKYDVAIVDMEIPEDETRGIPNADGSIVRWIRSVDPNIPIVVWTSHDDAKVHSLVHETNSSLVRKSEPVAILSAKIAETKRGAR